MTAADIFGADAGDNVTTYNVQAALPAASSSAASPAIRP